MKSALAEVARITGQSTTDFPSRGEPKIEQSYPYVDDDSRLLFEVVRLRPKGFRQRRPGPDGRWLWNLDGIEPVLFRLNEVRVAEEVLLLEGEKDVISWESLGSSIVATTNPMGAGKWRDNYACILSSKRVYVCGDNDAAGQQHVLKVLASLLEHASSSTIFHVEVPKEKGKDISDWIATDGSTVLAGITGSAVHVPSNQYLTELRDRWGLTPINTVGDKQPISTDHPAPRVGRVADSAKLVEIAKSSSRFFCDEVGSPYACFMIGTHQEVHALRSTRFKGWLARAFFASEGKVPSDQAISDAVQVLACQTCFEGSRHSVHLRLARVAECLYIDLGDDEWRVVQVTKDGWQVLETSPVYFRRTKGMKALPIPVKGGSVDALRPLVNGLEEHSWVLVVAWLLGALRGQKPYPILILQGEQGSGKSTTSRFVRGLLDPSVCSLRSLPKDERDLAIGAKNAFVLAFDNLSGIRPSISDALCRISTGAGVATRELYSDDEEAFFFSSRPIICNGIDEIANRSDLIDRALLVFLSPLSQNRRTEADLEQDFERVAPSVFGALLDAASLALKNERQVAGALPRMADFTRWMIAAEPALPWTAGTFERVYQESQEHSIAESLENDPVASLILWILKDRSEWHGTCSDLLRLLSGRTRTASSDWPRNANAIGNRVRRCQTFLRSRGVEIEWYRSRTQRTIRIRRTAFCDDVTSGDDCDDMRKA